MPTCRCQRLMSMFSERKDNAYVCRIGWPCWRVTLVAQRTTEVTDIPGVLQQSGWVRPEGGRPARKGPQAMSRSIAVSRAGPRSPGAVQAVSVASTGAMQIPREHPDGTMTRRPPCGCSPADPGDDDGSI